MSAGFTRAEVEAIAVLAELELDEAEMELFGRQLGGILQYARQVQLIDTTGVPPTATVVATHDADRADRVRPSLDLSESLAGAPDPAVAGGFFRVPRVIA